MLRNTCQKLVWFQWNLEGQFPDEQLGGLLVPPDLLEGNIKINISYSGMKNTFRATVPALNFLFFFSIDGTTAAAAYFLETIWKQDLVDEV